MGRRLRQIRDAHGLSQASFAGRIAVKQHTYNGWETGARQPNIDNALRIREEFGITLDFIFAGDHTGLDLRLWDAIRHNRRLK